MAAGQYSDVADGGSAGSGPAGVERADDGSLLGGLTWALPVALVIVVADQMSKRWAVDRLLPGSCDQPDACIDLVGGAKLHLVFNTGAAFAQGTGFGPVLGVLAAIITGILLFVAWRRADGAGSALAGAIAGGALGNLIDRATRAEDGFLSGAVVDFVDFGWWPVFNVADAAIVCGVLGFIVVSWRDDRREMAAAVTESHAPDSDVARESDAAVDSHVALEAEPAVDSHVALEAEPAVDSHVALEAEPAVESDVALESDAAVESGDVGTDDGATS